MRLLFVAACVMTALPLSGAWARSGPYPADLGTMVERTFSAWNVPGAAVVIVKDGRVILAKGYGVRSLTNRRPVGTRTSFYLASGTKGFTSTAVQILADESKVEIDRPAAEYLHEFTASPSARLHEVTVRDLLSHRTGFARTDLLMFGKLSNQTILERLGAVQPIARNRERFTYQNQMYLALSELVQRRAGRSWTKFVEARILAPLGMTSSNAAGLGHSKSPDFSTPHGLVEGKVVPVTFEPRKPYGGGGINTTADDVAKWMFFQLGDGAPILSAPRFAAMHQINTPMTSAPFAPGAKELGYGLGWFVHDYQGEPVVQHGGNGEGWTSLIWLEPRQKLGVAVLTNMHDSYLPWAIAFQVADRFSGTKADWLTRLRGIQSVRDKALLQRPSDAPIRADMSHWRGKWVHPVYGLAGVERAGKNKFSLTYGALAARLEPRDDKTAWAHWRRSDMTALLGVSKVGFSVDSKGQILSLSLGGEDIAFRRPS